MNVFRRILAVVFFAIVPAFAHAETSADTTASDSNTAVEGLTFDQRDPMADCRETQCYGARALRRAFELGRLTSVVMSTERSCAELNEAGMTTIPCAVDNDAPGNHWAQVDGQTVLVWNCHSLKCFGRQAISDLYDRRVIRGVALRTKAACDELAMDIDVRACVGDDDTRLRIKPPSDNDD